MNSLLKFLKLYIVLFLLEIFFVFIMILLFDSSTIDYSSIRRARLGSGLWNYWRLLFYSVPLVVIFFTVFKYMFFLKIKYKPVIFSFFNVLVYVLLSILSRVIWGENIPLPPEGMMFWITCISIFLSPLILGKIPYFKRLMEYFDYNFNSY